MIILVVKIIALILIMIYDIYVLTLVEFGKFDLVFFMNYVKIQMS